MSNRRFLPALRSKPHPALASSDLKVVLGDYYGALASAGVWSSSRSRPWPVERAIAEGYERIIWVFRSVEAISGQASRLPFRLKQGEDVLDDHPLYTIMNRRANPMETGRQFRKRLGAQILLSKRGAFVQVTKARNGTPLRMDLLPPGRTRPVPGSQVSGADPGTGGAANVLIDHYEVVRADGSRSFVPAEEVLWFREPHPLDPYSGVTPLEAAGMSVELDFFARMYNVMFLKNDGRPGGIVGINGDMDPDDMDRIEEKFGRGPAEAGKLTVIAGDVSYVDSVVRPRDMQYGDLAGNSKTEILSAFGVPESVLGYAADRTYANAGQEHLNFWQITMPPHMDLQVTGIDELSEPELEGFFDVSSVPALQALEAAKRAEAREEFGDGLITPDEYRDATGKEVFDVPATRCLYISNAMTPVPTSKADEKALSGMITPAASGAPAPAGTGDDAGDGDTGGTDDAADDGSADDGSGQKTLTIPAPAIVAAPRRRSGRPPLRVIAGCQVKAVGPAAGDQPESAAATADRDRLEDTLTAALTALGARWTQRTLARLGSPRTRKGTRHWAPGTEMKQDTRAGDQALDASQAVDGDRWQQEAQAAAGPVITAAAAAAAVALAADLAPAAPDAVTAAVQEAARVAAGQITTMVGDAAAGLAAKITALVNDADQAGEPMSSISSAVQDTMDSDVSTWAAGVATQAATATIAGARDAAAQTVAATDPGHAGREIVRVWRTRRDDKVRLAHRAAEGQTQPVGTPFTVGDALLRFPGDPLGPPGQVYNCRCVLNHRSLRTGQYVPTPEGEVTRAAGLAG